MNIPTLERLEHLPKGARIYVYGSGGRGKAFVKCLKSARPDVSVLGFLDSFKSGEIEGFPRTRFSGILDLERHDTIIVASAFHEQIVPILQNAGAADTRVLGNYYDYEYAMRQGKKLCVISANCQGGPVRRILNDNPAFREQYYPVHYLNFKKQKPSLAEWKNCGLCIYQYLSEEWGELAYDALLGNMPGDSQSIRIPKITWRPFWPTYFDDPRLLPERMQRYANRPYGDKYLWNLHLSQVNSLECVRRYMAEDLAVLYDLPVLVEANAAYLSSPENGMDIDMSSVIEKSICDSYCMYGYNHPSVEMHGLMIEKILAKLGIGVINYRDVMKYDDFSAACIPIHPSIIEYFNLPYVGVDSVYDLWGMKFTAE